MAEVLKSEGLFGVTISRKDWHGGHQYEVEGDDRVAGVKMRSVTGLLNRISKPGLYGWMESNGREAILKSLEGCIGQVMTREMFPQLELTAKAISGADTKSNRERGTNIHSAVDMLLKGERVDRYDDDEVRPALEAIPLWLNHAGWLASSEPIHIMLTEQLVYSPSWMLGGTVDCIGQDGEVSFVGDFKTSSRIRESDIIQVCGYKAMLIELGHPVDQGRIIHLPTEQRGGWSEHIISPEEEQWGLTAMEALVSLDVALRGIEKSLKLEVDNGE